MVLCFRTKSLMDSSLLLYSSTVGFAFWFCVSWGSLSVRCAIALVCMPVLSVGISLCPSFILCLRSLLVIVSLSLSRLFCCYLSRSFLFAVSLESLCSLIGWCIWHFRAKCQFAYHRAIVYCLLRKSLGCLNRLVYMALLGEVSIGCSQV